MKYIGVIGGGAAGLCAVRHILATPGLIPICWETQDDVGGQWLYSPIIECDKFGFPVHSSMYSSLRTNLPKEVMKFPDFPFSNDLKHSFIHHSNVLQYLRTYAEHFHLHEYIKFNHHVVSVRVNTEDDTSSWEIHVKDLNTGSISSEVCDYVFVCNGHASVPRITEIKNIDKFKGKKMHSHYYRDSTSFKGSRIAVLGAAASGLDISMELSAVAEQIFLCHNLAAPNSSEFPRNVLLKPGIKEAMHNGFLLHDDSIIEVDTLLFCTGYQYCFPFLDASSDITTKNGYVEPLYKYVINISHPSMFLIGMNFQICPFPFFDMQIRYCIEICKGNLSLPDKSTMETHTQDVFLSKLAGGIPKHHLFKLGKEQWTYMDNLAEEARIKPLDEVFQLIYTHCERERRTRLRFYQNNTYTVLSSDSFHVDIPESNCQ